MQERQAEPGISWRARLAALATGNLGDVLPGALIGLGGAAASSQAGWFTPTTFWLAAPTLAGAALTLLALRVAKSRQARRLVALSSITVSLVLLLLAFLPRPDVEPVGKEQDVRTVPADDPEEEGGVSGAGAGARAACGRFLFADDVDVVAEPLQGGLGSASNPVRIEVIEDTELSLSITTERDQPYDFVQLRARVVGLPLVDREVAFAEGSLTFDERTASFSNLRIGPDNTLRGFGQDPNESIPVPFGIIELAGGFSDAPSDDFGCPFRVHVQLVSSPAASGPAKVAVLTLLGGLAALLWKLAGAFRTPKKTGQGSTNDQPTSEDADTATTDDATPVDMTDAKMPDVEVYATSDSGPVDDRRLGVEAFLGQDKLTGALVADEMTYLWVSIAQPTEDIQQLSKPINVDFTELAHRQLTISLSVDGVEQQKQIMLRKDPSMSANAVFNITPTGDLFEAIVGVYDEDGRGIQGAALSVEVMPTRDAADAQRGFHLICIPIGSLAIEDTTHDTGTVMHTENLAAGSGDFSPVVDVAQALAEIRKVGGILAESARRHAGLRIAGLPPDHVVDHALVAVAKAGYEMRARMKLDCFDDVERIQVVSFQSQSVLPLELAYQGKISPDPDPSDEATMVCKQWSTGCSCADLPIDDQELIVCPSLFWGISKIVEHHVNSSEPGTVGEGTAHSRTFTLREVREPDSAPLTVPNAAIVGMSELVVKALAPRHPDEPDKVEQEILAEFRRRSPKLATTSVPTWRDWRKQVREGAHDLLIAMPHQQVDDYDSALEIGGTHIGLIEQIHVATPEQEPPIVMLIGCNTGIARDAISAFAAQFQDHSRLVVATIGEIVAFEAPDLIAEIMHQLEVHGRRPDGTIGEAIRDARRTLVANNHAAGLQLVVHGDATWPLALKDS